MFLRKTTYQEKSIIKKTLKEKSQKNVNVTIVKKKVIRVTNVTTKRSKS